MYVYIYDAITEKRKNHKNIINLEKKITDLGLGGKIIRLQGINNIEKIIQDETKHGVKTVVSVGTDYTLHKTLNAVLKNPGETPVIGIIPLDKKNNLIAQSLGLNSIEQSCNALLSRRIEKINVGKIDKYYFLSELEVKGENNEIKIGDNYSIEVKKPCEIKIINIPLTKDLTKKIKVNFKDKNLKLYIQPQKYYKKGLVSNQSILSLTEMFITEKTKKIIIDNCFEFTGRALISSTQKKINLIVGKDRSF